jgi:hypothetical protein
MPTVLVPWTPNRDREGPHGLPLPHHLSITHKSEPGASLPSLFEESDIELGRSSGVLRAVASLVSSVFAACHRFFGM